MGKPYTVELEELSATYSWAAKADISELIAAVSASATLPLLAVGSGGSLSAAYHASELHQEYIGLLSKAVTPLELVRSSINLRAHGVLLLSAGGTNADIVGSLRNVIEREPRRCIVLCFRRGSALTDLAAQYRYVNLVEMNPPVGKDGFLSTNSLIAFAVLLERAYARVFGKGEVFPEMLDNLLPSASLGSLIAKFRKECKPLWERNTILLLHGAAVHAAAIDLESKFSEAALGNVQVADFRNFAHGRHNWIAKRAETTGILALFSDSDRELADATLRLLPDKVPVARIDLPASGATARVAALMAVLHVVGDVGEARDVDPGRPHVAAFGRQIYHLRAFSKSRSPRLLPQALPIARKVAADAHKLTGRPDLEAWQKAYRAFLTSLGGATFGAILFDYDGTLCDSRDRFTKLADDIAFALKRILVSSIPIGIATGRGKSVRESLQNVLPERVWGNVLVGYYNCTDIAALTDDTRPDSTNAPIASLSAAAAALSLHPSIQSLATVEVRPTQISVQPNSSAASELVWRVALDLVQSYSDLKIVRSSHSVDILQQTASKKALLTVLSDLVVPKHVLCIGDMGRWPGNDHDILATEHALSVDEVSTAIDSCWNLAPVGYRGAQATLHYVDSLVLRRSSFTVDADRLVTRSTTKDRL